MEHPKIGSRTPSPLMSVPLAIISHYTHMERNPLLRCQGGIALVNHSSWLQFPLKEMHGFPQAATRALTIHQPRRALIDRSGRLLNSSPADSIHSTARCAGGPWRAPRVMRAHFLQQE
jgi:hypothetical protein